MQQRARVFRGSAGPSRASTSADIESVSLASGAAELARATMLALLGSMPKHATVQVVSFGSTHEYLAPAPMMASGGVVAEVYRAIADSTDPWGTTGAWVLPLVHHTQPLHTRGVWLDACCTDAPPPPEQTCGRH